ncbi:hypothetical protein JCM16418A_14410 [Paenibacillus pini]
MVNWVNIDVFIRKQGKLCALTEVTNKVTINPVAQRKIYSSKTGSYIIINNEKRYFHMHSKLEIAYKNNDIEYLTPPFTNSLKK